MTSGNNQRPQTRAATGGLSLDDVVFTVFRHKWLILCFMAMAVAAASLGQVHRASFEGREVVVKVLRPGIERLVASDVTAAKRILRLLERRFATNPHVRGLRVAVEEFSLRIGDEQIKRGAAILRARHAPVNIFLA